MTFIVDTNVLLRLDHIGHPHRQKAQAAIERLIDEQQSIRTVPQVLYEYWVVATRPVNANGLGFSVLEAERMLADHKELFPPLRDERGILERWEDLVNAHQVLGKSAHDARLVAAMIRHGLTQVLTFNDRDFARFKEITAVTPDSVLSR
jgi:predicted nucleic acid-binding protein